MHNLQQKLSSTLKKRGAPEAKKKLATLTRHELQVLFESPFTPINLFLLLPSRARGQMLIALSKKSKLRTISKLSDEQLVATIEELGSQQIRELMASIEKKRGALILGKINRSTRKHVELLLTFESESAGGIMDVDIIRVNKDHTVGDIVNRIKDKDIANRKHGVVLSSKGKKQRYLPLRKLITSPTTETAGNIAEHLPTIHAHVDQENILHIIAENNCDMVGVLSELDELIGVIHVNDLIDIASVEATEDIYKFAGVHPGETIHDSFLQKIKKRSPWLLLNLATAFLASLVIAQFADTISQIAILAALMPVVAGEGGNAATQALAVAVRGLSTGTISPQVGRLLVIREAAAGLCNGVITGIVAGCISILMGGSIMLGVVLCTALSINLFVAGGVGAFVPLVLKRMNIDPAVASSVFVTTATDIVGFLSFLGLASLLLL